MKKIIVLILVIVLSATVVHADGSASEDIKDLVLEMETASDGDFHFNKYQEGPGVAAEYWLTTNDVTADEFTWEMKSVVNQVFRNSFYNEMGTSYFVNFMDEEKTHGIWTIQGSQIQKLVDNENWVKNWLNENVRGIVSNGMTRDQAIEVTYNWLINQGEYAWEDMTDRKYQSLRPLLEEGRGVCASYCLAFRAILEYVPFNENWIVDYETGTQYITVNFIHTTEKPENGSLHIFTGIQNLDGIYQFWDLSAYEAYGYHLYGVDWETMKKYCPQSCEEAYRWYY